jgi:trehalose 6-phosphate synthase/phosphatase
METAKIVDAYKHATKRLLLLDYDGVLAPIVSLPEQAMPSRKMYGLLEKLTADTRNTCVVVSGRDHETLDEWLGGLPLAFAAEHGLWRRDPQGTWGFVVEVETGWKSTVRNIMQPYATLLEGSFVEEKYAGVGFHYRTATAKDARQTVERLIHDLEPFVSGASLKLLDGKKVVEIIPDGVDKGTAAKFWLDSEEWDFVLAAGDDVTDEALFKVLLPSDYSIKVGEGITAASTTVPSQPEFVRLLEAFTSA